MFVPTFNAEALGNALPELGLPPELPDLSDKPVVELGEEFLRLVDEVAPRLRVSTMLYDSANSRRAVLPLPHTYVGLTRTRPSFTENHTTLRISGPKPDHNTDSVEFQVRRIQRRGTPLDIKASLAFHANGKHPDFFFAPLLGISPANLSVSREHRKAKQLDGALDVVDGQEQRELEAKRALGFSVLLLRTFEPETFRLVESS